MKKRCIRSKKGFTLLETMVVVFITAVIASATVVAVKECINSSQKAADRISSRESIIESILAEQNGSGSNSSKPFS